MFLSLTLGGHETEVPPIHRRVAKKGRACQPSLRKYTPRYVTQND